MPSPSLSSPVSKLAPHPVSATQKPARRGAAQKRSRPSASTAREPALFPSPPRSTSTPERLAKRRKTRDTDKQPSRTEADPYRSPAFWDRLTRIPLVEAALQELDRRNKDVAGRSCARRPTPVQSDLDRYARHGGPDLSDLRGFEDMPRQQTQRNRGGVRKPRGRGRGQSQSSSQSTTTCKTKSSSPYDAAFRQHLVDGRVWPIGHYLENGQKPATPNNLQDIIRVICTAARSSLEPENFAADHFSQFEKAYNLARSEEGRSRTLDYIEGSTLALSSSHVKQGPVKLTNLLPLLPENLVPGNPDRVYGARPETLDHRVRGAIGSLILPTTARDIVCPNFIVHVKGPAGDPETAKVQAVYDGALAARGMEALRAYGGEGAGDGDGEPLARTITCTFADGVLRMYAVHYFSRTPSGRMPKLLQQEPSWAEDAEYVTSFIGSWLMHDSLEDFRRGAAAFRNGLDWAHRQRDEAIGRANAKAIEGAASASATEA